MNPRQIFLILRLRWLIVLGTLLAATAAALIISLMLPKQYTAETSLLVDTRGGDPLLATLAPNFAMPSHMATQTEILQSDRVASLVVKMLGLAQNAKAVEQWREETQGRIPLETYFGSLLQKGLKVEPGRGSSLLTVSFTGTDPKFAAAGANTFARAYLDTSVALVVDPARESAKFFDERIKQLRTELEGSQERLSAFQQKRGIVVTNERMDQEVSRLTSLETSLGTALAEQADTSSRTTGSGADDSAAVLSSPAVQGIKSELARAQTQLTEISSKFGSSHPQRIEIEARVAELRQQLNAEMGRVGRGTKSVNVVAGAKIAELKSLVEGQKKAVLALRSQRDEAAVLLRDVDTAQRAYDAVAQRRTGLANEVKAEQAAARVLSPATEPLNPSKPNIVKNTLVGLILGALGGVGLAFLLEYIDRRVRSADDLVAYSDVPVLGVMSDNASRSRSAPRLAHQRRPALPSPQLTFDGGVQ
jgi:chain length determinant protein EpsF